MRFMQNNLCELNEAFLTSTEITVMLTETSNCENIPINSQLVLIVITTVIM